MLVYALALALAAAPAAAPSAHPPVPAQKAAKTAPATGPRADAVAVLKTKDGKTVGEASLYEGPNGVMVRIEAAGLKPGWHGAHLHEFGRCDAPDFKSAGGHFNPSRHAHGLLNPQGAEAGDLPNLFVNQGGVVRAAFFVNGVSIKGQGGRPALLDADGTALVIHENVDDQMSQPIGNSGAREACGVIKPTA